MKRLRILFPFLLLGCIPVSSSTQPLDQETEDFVFQRIQEQKIQEELELQREQERYNSWKESKQQWDYHDEMLKTVEAWNDPDCQKNQKANQLMWYLLQFNPSYRIDAALEIFESCRNQYEKANTISYIETSLIPLREAFKEGIDKSDHLVVVREKTNHLIVRDLFNSVESRRSVLSMCIWGMHMYEKITIQTSGSSYTCQNPSLLQKHVEESKWPKGEENLPEPINPGEYIPKP